MPKPVAAAARLRRFRAELAAVASPARAVSEKKYMKSALTFVGVRVPDVRRIAVSFAKSSPDLTHAELRAIVDACFATDVHELRSLAIALLEAKTSLLRAADAAWLVSLVRASPYWAHVDWIAATVLGAVVEAHPRLLETTRRWARDASFWVRRTALLVQLLPLRRGEGDFALFTELAVPMLAEREFFIRKAIGWVLREASKKRPELVRAFFEAHGAECSGLTRREGTKYLAKA